MTDDTELLGRYAADRSEAAFAELTDRYVGLVYSAALRLVNGDVHSAQDVTQQVFVELARSADRLARHPVLAGWLYTTTRLTALNMNRTDQRRKAREQKATMMNELLQDDGPPADWSQLSPVIEEAMHELNDEDRHAILLRFFQNNSLNEVGARLNLTDNAARMRVARALERLREALRRRGITTTAVALAAAVSAHAVQTVPAGLTAAISTAAAASGAVHATAQITTTLVMTTLQKTVVAAALMLAAGTGILALHQRSQFQEQVQVLRQEEAPINAQVAQLRRERDETAQRMAALEQENERLKSGQRDLLKLRGQVGVLREKAAAGAGKSDAPTSGLAKMMSDPAMKEYLRQAQLEKIRSMYTDFFKEMKMTPEQTDAFLQVLTDLASNQLTQYTAAAEGTPSAGAASGTADMISQLRALLGDSGMAQFNRFSGEIPARTTISLLNGELGTATLSDEQRARLIQIIGVEPANLTMGITGAPDKAFLGSQAEIDNFLQEVDQSNQRILQQAGGVLTSDQLAALNSVLASGLNARKLQAAALIQKH